MQLLLKTLFNVLILWVGLQTSYAQKACCTNGGEAPVSCCAKEKGTTCNKTKACCSSTSSKETTSGCTPSNCRGAKTKFGEAKVISELRLDLIALKAKMENHSNFQFSEKAISVHDIIGETDEKSLEIVFDHMAIIEAELSAMIDREIPRIHFSDSKAVTVRQLKERISLITNLL